MAMMLLRVLVLMLVAFPVLAGDIRIPFIIEQSEGCTTFARQNAICVDPTTTPSTKWEYDGVTVNPLGEGTPSLQAVKDINDTINNATTPASGVYIGDTVAGNVLYTDGTGTARLRAANAALTVFATRDLVMESGSDWDIVNENGTSCYTIDSVTGVLTNNTAGTCTPNVVTTAATQTLTNKQFEKLNLDGTTCLDVSSDRLYHDTNCNAAKDAGEHFIDARFHILAFSGEDGANGATDEFLIPEETMNANGITDTEVTASRRMVAEAGTLKNLNCWTNDGPGAGITWTFIIVQNGTDTAMDCAITGTGVQTCTETVTTVATVANDRISIRKDESGGTVDSTGGIRCTVVNES